MYIPPNKIDPKVYYTSGGEYYYASNLVNYVGYYKKDVNGKAYAGKVFTNTSPKLLPIRNFLPPPPVNINKGSDLSNSYYSILSSTNSTPVQSLAPVPNSLPPIQQDYEQTYYTRYFLEYLLSSQPVIIEVNKGTYFTYINSELKKYFNYVEVLWKISGPLYDVKKDNIMLQGGVIDSNLRSIQQAQKTMPGIEKQLADLTLYYKN